MTGPLATYYRIETELRAKRPGRMLFDEDIDTALDRAAREHGIPLDDMKTLVRRDNAGTAV